MAQELKVAILSENWLATSETFILRQVLALEEYQIPSIILTQNKMHTGSLDLDTLKHRLIFEARKKRIQFWKDRLDKLFLNKENYFEATAKQKKIWKNAIQENQINLIHAHYGYFSLKILPIAQSLNIPLVTTFHGNDASLYLRDKSYLKSLKALFKYSSIVTVSEDMRQKLLQLGALPERTICLYIGTNLADFPFHVHPSLKEKAAKNQPIQLLQISNFVEKKGHAYTLKAFADFLKFYPTARLVLAGDGKLKESVQKLAEQLRISEKVCFLGKVKPKEVATLLQDSDIFVHHSVTAKSGSQEGIPTVLMEAMASGIPVVSTFHSGIPELIENNVSGILVKEKDCAAYTEALTNLLKSDTVSLTENALKKVKESFDIKIQNDKLLQLYPKIGKGK